MAPRFYRVGPSIWDEPWNDDTRLTALYLLTNSHRNTEGLFRMPLAYAAADLRWKPARLEKSLEVLVDAGFVKFDADAQVMWIVKALVWQAPQNPNQVTAAVKALRALPRTPLLREFATVCATVAATLAEALRKEFPEAFGEPLPEPVANTPSPSPSPDNPPNPPQAGGTLRVPVKPSGKRKTDLAAYDREVDALAAGLFPLWPLAEARCAVQSVLSRGEGYHGNDVEVVRVDAQRWAPGGEVVEFGSKRGAA